MYGTAWDIRCRAVVGVECQGGKKGFREGTGRETVRGVSGSRATLSEFVRTCVCVCV